MEIMVGIKQFEKKEIIVDQQMRAVFDVSVLIGITGACTGSIIISFSKEVATEMVSKLLGEHISEFDDKACDAIGEMVNIITVNASAELLKNHIGKIDQSLPNVIIGKGHNIRYPSSAPCINIVYDTELGPFAMQVNLKFD